jgi:hypothetical protein
VTEAPWIPELDSHNRGKMWEVLLNFRIAAGWVLDIAEKLSLGIKRLAE